MGGVAVFEVIRGGDGNGEGVVGRELRRREIHSCTRIPPPLCLPLTKGEGVGVLEGIAEGGVGGDAAADENRFDFIISGGAEGFGDKDIDYSGLGAGGDVSADFF